MNIVKEINIIIKDVSNENYVKAHDFLEILWRKYKNFSETREESFILKAFVNALGYLELVNMNRIAHANNVWKTYEKYERLIDELDSINKTKYLELKKTIYKKRN